MANLGCSWVSECIYRGGNSWAGATGLDTQFLSFLKLFHGISFPRMIQVKKFYS